MDERVKFSDSSSNGSRDSSEAVGCGLFDRSLNLITVRNVFSTFLLDFYAHYRLILHHLATVHNAAERQTTDRAVGIGCLCYSISGLKYFTTKSGDEMTLERADGRKRLWSEESPFEIATKRFEIDLMCQWKANRNPLVGY